MTSKNKLKTSKTWLKKINKKKVKHDFPINKKQVWFKHILIARTVDIIKQMLTISKLQKASLLAYCLFLEDHKAE